MTNDCIRLEHVSKRFGRTEVLKDLSAVLHRGEILGFLGPSGAGKTTAIKILTGQLKASSGEAFVLGTRVESINETIYEQIGIVTDQSGVYERLTVYANLHYFAKILRVDAARGRASGNTGKNRRASSPRGRPSGWCWSGQYSTGPRSCFWMSPPAAWTPPPLWTSTAC